jgi:hypothetical protein
VRRRDFIRGLMALGVTAAVADKLAFAEGLGRAFASAETRDRMARIRAALEAERAQWVAVGNPSSDATPFRDAWLRAMDGRSLPLSVPPPRKWFTLDGTPVAVMEPLM